jgi:hypothetical protein
MVLWTAAACCRFPLHSLLWITILNSVRLSSVAWQQGCQCKSGSRLPQSKRLQSKRPVNSREGSEWVRCLAC